jgi:sterol desaturase/sphingolipid hydroxylase (fatty acid hydroxylase superfamily)
MKSLARRDRHYRTVAVISGVLFLLVAAGMLWFVPNPLIDHGEDIQLRWPTTVYALIMFVPAGLVSLLYAWIHDSLFRRRVARRNERFMAASRSRD